MQVGNVGNFLDPARTVRRGFPKKSSGRGNLNKIQKNSYFFRELFPYQASSDNHDHKKQQITKIERESQNYEDKRLQNDFFAQSSFSPAPPPSCLCKDQRRQMLPPLQQTAEGSASAREDQLVSRRVLFKQLRS